MRKPKVFSFTLLIPVMIMFVAGVWSTPTQADAPATGTPPAYGTPTTAPRGLKMSASGVSPAEQQAIEKVIRSYFDIRYGAFITLELGSFGNLIATSPEAQSGATTVRGGQLKRALRHVFLLKTVDSGATRGQEERLAG